MLRGSKPPRVRSRSSPHETAQRGAELLVEIVVKRLTIDVVEGWLSGGL